MSSTLKYRIKMYGGDNHYRVAMDISTDSPERVELLRKFAIKNKYQIRVELIE